MADVEPPELARLLAYAERPRVDDWSLRSALTRYGQPQPLRASRLTEIMRRLDRGLSMHAAEIEGDGAARWEAVAAARADDAAGELLLAAAAVDRFADALAAWAVARAGDRPDAALDAVADDVEACVERLGIPKEEERPNRASGRKRAARG
jgi:hypothetical protein